MLPETERQLLARTARLQRDGRLPSLVAGVVHDGQSAWWAGRGRVDGAPPTADTQYRIGSITKTFTAVLVLRLRDEGRLDLADRVDVHVPDAPFGDRTVGQLLAHVGGLPAELAGQWWERTPGPDWAGLVERVGDDAAPFAAGRRFHYSNLGYGVLGRIVEALRGRSWADCARTEITEPLEMRRTGPDPVAPAAPGLAVHPWADLVHDEPTPDTVAMGPAGQLWSTTADLGRFARLLLGDTGGVLSPDTVLEMAEPGPLEATTGAWQAYGLGLQIRNVDGRILIGHGGSMPGFLAVLLVEPGERSAVTLMTNSTGGLDGNGALDLLGILRDREPVVVEEWLPSPNGVPDDLVDAVGPWYWGPYAFSLSVRPDGGLELGALGPGRRSRFRRDAEGQWIGTDGYYAGEALRVVRDGSGAVSHLDVATFVFTRTPYGDADVTPGGASGWRPAG